jgi:hypothetical protein
MRTSTTFSKGKPKTGGRQPGSPNRVNTALKDAILAAADSAGGKDGLVGYLTAMARNQPVSFLSLLGKMLPLTIAGDADQPVKLVVEWQSPENRP